MPTCGAPVPDSWWTCEQQYSIEPVMGIVLSIDVSESFITEEDTFECHFDIESSWNLRILNKVITIICLDRFQSKYPYN